MRRSLAVASLLIIVATTSTLGLPVNAYGAVPQCGNTQLQANMQKSVTAGPVLPWDLARLPAGINGAGIRVAVLDSGVDSRHEKLRGKVIGAQREFFRPATDPKDCKGHGTGVASLIAGSATGQGFRGIAPGVQILSARVSEKMDSNAQAPEATEAQMALAVRWAVANGARVINFSLAYTSDHPRLAPLKLAIADAIATGRVVVVAAVGNKKGEGNPKSYPAAWPNVVGVGALNVEGTRLDQSQTGDYVDIAAIGQGVLTAWPSTNVYTHQTGTSFATPLVSATIALIMQQYPDLTAAQVVKRLLATSDPAPGGRHSDGYGYGVLNPIRAVTDVLDEARPLAPLAVPPHVVTEQEAAAAARAETAWADAVLISGIGVVIAAIAVALMVGLPAGARRRWQRP